MRREVPVEDLEKLYTSNDMVKADCRGCEGCSDCCSGMGESVVLDPYDCFELEKGLGLSFGELLERAAELNVSDGLILPNLRMNDDTETCMFLDQRGRCSVHAIRPGICRLFPLGRYYDERGFSYFLQSHECPMESRSKIKISKWLSIPNLKKYEAFVLEWHRLLEEIRVLSSQSAEEGDERFQSEISTYLLDQFYGILYDPERDFYDQFKERYDRMRKLIRILGHEN